LPSRAENLVTGLVSLLVGGLVLNKWISFTKFFRWLLKKPQKQIKVKGSIAKYLKGEGYHFIAEKCKVPLTITSDEDEYKSRLYTDYVVKKEGKVYLVFIAREQRQIKYSGAFLRDFLLAHYLTYRPEGIIYISRDLSLRLFKIKMNPTGLEGSGYKKEWSFFLAGLAVGALILIISWQQRLS
jgi:hypothetical protein